MNRPHVLELLERLTEQSRQTTDNFVSVGLMKQHADALREELLEMLAFEALSTESKIA